MQIRPFPVEPIDRLEIEVSQLSTPDAATGEMSSVRILYASQKVFAAIQKMGILDARSLVSDLHNKPQQWADTLNTVDGGCKSEYEALQDSWQLWENVRSVLLPLLFASRHPTEENPSPQEIYEWYLQEVESSPQSDFTIDPYSEDSSMEVVQCC